MKTKKPLLFFCLFLLAQMLKAQPSQFYSVIEFGGQNFNGVIFRTDSGGKSYDIPYNFTYSPINTGTEPSGNVIKASNGKLYGMTSSGGANQNGVIFSFNPVDSDYEDIYDLDAQYLPNGVFQQINPGLMQASNGLIYGMMVSGGANGSGIIFSIDPGNANPSSTFTDVHDFNGADGGDAQFSFLIQISPGGKLYGMTEAGGTFGPGVVFSFDPNNPDPATNYLILHSFSASSTALRLPYGSLLCAKDGKFYGMTYFGGSGGFGGIFRMDTTGANYSELVVFTGNTGPYSGANPTGTLMQASNGLIYGMSYLGGTYQGQNGYDGNIFRFDPSNANPASTFTDLHDFVGPTDGSNPFGDLMQASDGKLYGMGSDYNQDGPGNSSAGEIFKLNPDGSGYEVIHFFMGAPSDGNSPAYGNVIEVIPPVVSNPGISVNTPSPFCAGGTAVLTASCSANCTGITYTWAPSTGLNATTGATVTANPISTITYTVTGTNTGGGTATATSVVTVDPLPAAPLATAGTGATTTQITANWGSVGGATAYFLDVSTGNSFGSFVGIYNNLNVGNVLTKNVTGLTAGTTYYYRVRVSNGTCTSNNSNVITYATTGAPACAPVGGTISPASSIICNGGTQALSVSGSNGNNYIWQISADDVTWSSIAGATTTSYTTASGNGLTDKYYRLLSISSVCGNVVSTTALVQVSNPVIVLTTTSITDQTITLNWSPVGSGNYTVSWSGTSAGSSSNATPPKTITGLTPGGTYNITVTQTGLSLSSCPASGTVSSVTTLCSAPTGVTATTPANNEMIVSWTGTAANYRVFYRPLYTANTYYTKDVIGATSTTITKLGNNILPASTSFEVYVSSLDCPTSGAVGEPSSKIYVTTPPAKACATPLIDSVKSTCPIQIEVWMHPGSSPSGIYQIYFQRLTPTIQAVVSYQVNGNYFTVNIGSAGQTYLITAASDCGSGVYSNLVIWPGNLTVKPLCSTINNLVLSNPTCHGFTASWNIDQCLSNNVSYYQIYLRQQGNVNYNSYPVQPVPAPPITPGKTVNWLGKGTIYQVYIRSIYSCNGYNTAGPASQVLTDTTLSSGCKEEDQQAEPNQPSVQQYSPDKSEVLNIYPNPNNGEFMLDISQQNNSDETVRVEVMNMLGQTVMTHFTSISGGRLNEFMHLPENTSSGDYFVRVTVGNNVYTTKVNISR